MYNKCAKAITVIAIIAACAIIAKCITNVICIAAVDTNKSYKYAIVYTPDGEVFHEGEITRYIMHTGAIEVKFKDDEWYYTSSNNCVLYGERDLDQEMGMHDM